MSFAKTMAKRNFFTDFELNLLKELVQNKKSVLENKRTDFKSIKEKKTAWYEIAYDFNSYYNVSKRDEQLRKCWNNLKARAKKKDAEERRERLRTGGGKVSVSVDDDSLQVGAMVATQIKPMQNQYDGDAGPDDEYKEITIDEEEGNTDDEAFSGQQSDGVIKGIKIISNSKKKSPNVLKSSRKAPISTVQKTVLERQQEEHDERMKLVKYQLQCAQDEHSMKMEILRLKKRKLESQLQTRNETSTSNSRSTTNNLNTISVSQYSTAVSQSPSTCNRGISMNCKSKAFTITSLMSNKGQ